MVSTAVAPQRKLLGMSASVGTSGPALAGPDMLERLRWLVDMFGNNRVAELIGVSRSQPSRWLSGQEGMGPQSRRRVADLDYVLGRLVEVSVPKVAWSWLHGDNALLGGRPIDVLLLRGPLAILAAVDLEAEWGYV